MNPPSEIRSRFLRIRERIAAAAERAGRDPNEITLVGASKRQDVAKLRAAFEAGLVVFGENRVQEARDKAPALPEGIDWHLIGPLQSNKARLAVQLFSTVHSVDRLKIARALDREAGLVGKRLRCLLEINLGGEASKHGFSPEGVEESLESVSALDNLDLIGLMAIPPFGSDPESSRPWFRRLRELRDRLGAKSPGPAWSGALSMGMSGDFEVAIEEGATHVRVGTALFGERPSVVG